MQEEIKNTGKGKNVSTSKFILNYEIRSMSLKMHRIKIHENNNKKWEGENGIKMF